MKNTWDLKVATGWVVGLAICVLCIAIVVALVALAVMQPVSVWTFLMGLGAVATLTLIIRVIYQLWGLTNAAYDLDRNALVIHWGGVTHQIPLASVQDVLSGAEIGPVRMRPGLRWPGYVVGLGEAQEIGTVLFFATESRNEQVIIRTTGMAYAISPQDLETFLPALKERLDMGPTQEVEETSTHPAFLDWTIWKDRLGLSLLLGSTTLLVLLVGLLCWRYPHLPAEIVMRFDPLGKPLLIVAASGIFYIAQLGVIFLVINGGLGLFFYNRERTATYFLWSGLLAVQGGLWAAAISILLQQ